MTACFPQHYQRSVPIFGDSGPILLALTVGIFAPLSGWAATRRARNPIIWFALGACSGPAALFILAIAPPGRCPDCDRPVPGWNRACARCGAEFPPIWEEEDDEPASAVPGVTAAATASARPPVPATERAGSTAKKGRSSVAQGGPATNGSRRPAQRRSRPARVTEPVATVVEANEPAAPGREPTTDPAPRAAETAQPVPTPPPPARTPVRPPERALSIPLADAEVRVLSTGIYILGNAGLEVGARYGLARVGDRLRVFGPVDLGEVTVRHERPLAELEVTGIGDQLIISMANRGSGLAMVFQSLGGMQPPEIERALSEPDPQDGSSVAQPS